MHDFFVERLRDFLTTVTAVTTVIFLLSHYFWKEQIVTFDNQCDVLRAAFWDSCDVFFGQRGFVILFVESLRDFVCGEVAWFLCFFSWSFGDFLWRGCVIFFAHRFCAFLVNRLIDFFLVERLRDKKRGCVILRMERLHGFCVLRGCVIFLNHFLSQAWFFFLSGGCVIIFLRWGCVIFLLRDCEIFCVKRWLDFLCEEVAWFLCEDVFF